MKIETLPLSGPLLITPHVFADPRGFFQESWNQQVFNEAVGPTSFVQDNHSRSSLGVLRGLHYQLPPQAQGKLVRCVRGEIFDVAVDVRRGSSSFGAWTGVHLSEHNQQQLWVPPGFAHGFLTLSSLADVLYKTTHVWSRSCERSLRWDDPTLGIEWPLSLVGQPLLSEKDAQAPLLSAVPLEDLFA